MGSLLLDVGSRNDLSGKVEPFTEVIETLRGESVVVVLPRELGLDVAAGGERLACLDNVEVLGVNVVVLWKVVVLLCDEDTLSEEVFVDLLTVCLWNKPGIISLLSNSALHSENLTSWRLSNGCWFLKGRCGRGGRNCARTFFSTFDVCVRFTPR